MPVQRERAARQLLSGEPAGSAAAAVERLLAVQAQDLRSAALAIRARSTVAREADVGVGDGLVGSWLMRGTLHLVREEDLAWLLAIFGPRFEQRMLRRLAQLGLADPEPLARRVASRAADAPVTRAEVAQLTGLTGQLVPHLIALCAARGDLVLVGAHTYACVRRKGQSLSSHATAVGRKWPPSRSHAELARRYLAAHAPATAHDFARWSRLPLGVCRRALADAGDPPPVEVPDAVGPKLLPAFDPWALGWRATPVSDTVVASRWRPGGGMVRAAMLDDGVVVGTWTMPGGEPKLDPPDERFADEVRAVRAFAG